MTTGEVPLLLELGNIAVEFVILLDISQREILAIELIPLWCKKVTLINS